MLNIPSKSRGLADENTKFLTEWKWFETSILLLSSVGFGILNWHMKIPRMWNIHDRFSSSESRGIKILQKYIASSVNSTREVNTIGLFTVVFWTTNR